MFPGPVQIIVRLYTKFAANIA